MAARATSATRPRAAKCSKESRREYTGRSGHSLLLLNFDGRSDLVRCAEPLVVGVFDGETDVHTAAGKMQNIVGVRVGREPVGTCDVFPVRFEVRENVFVVL